MKKLILALDVYDFESAKNLIDQTKDYVDIFKVGPILFLQCGHKIVDFINAQDKKVFLDLKFHDIASTVARSIKSAGKLGIYSLTVHCAGGKEMLEAAASVESRPKVWAVTALTSMAASEKEVLDKAILAKACGLDGVIASPLEAKAIKQKCGFEVITPGIRIETSNDDQKRIANPEFAISQGADFIVVGRPIIESGNPNEAARGIFERCLV